jgi:hypothetical protein
MRKLIVLLVALLILAGYLYFSGPDKVVISEKGRVEGIVNKMRALVQDKKFWNAQLIMATSELNKIQGPSKPSSAEMRQLYHEMREAERVLDEKMKVLYSDDEQEALQLRVKADSLERAGKWKTIDDEAEQLRMKELDRLKVIIPLIQGKLSSQQK